MSYTPDKLVSFATRFEQISAESLEKSAKKKEKVDPKAKVRNRGSVCVPAEQAKDKKDHFPINDEGQARNALARVHQYSSAPDWYKGSLKGLQALVARKVKAKYPKIDVGGKDSKKKSAYYEAALTKYAQFGTPNYNPNNPFGLNPPAKPNTANDPFGFMNQTFAPIQIPTTPAAAPTATTNTPAAAPTTPAPVAAPPTAPAHPQPKWTGPTINPVFQTMLGVNPDGKLGPQTQAALNMYKKNRNPSATNALLFEYLKKEPEYSSKKPMVYDDNSNIYQKSST